MRHPIVDAVHGVGGDVLQEWRDVVPVWDEGRVDGCDLARIDEAVRRVAGRRHAVVESVVLRHQGEHVVRSVGDLRLDLARRFPLERMNPVVLLGVRAILGVAGPYDDVELTLARPDCSGQARRRAGIRAWAAGR